jgi:transcriptional regulator with XRE-family HTH domain
LSDYAKIFTDVDGHLGDKLRIRRKAVGMTQVTLAERMGLSYQQIQKYERGTSRLSASQLCRLAEALDVHIAYFFEGLLPEGSAPSGFDDLRPEAVVWLKSPEGRDFTNRMCTASPVVLTGMLALAQALVPNREAA